jgi:hypothetical protein
MAKSHHKEVASTGTPTNPLARPFWTQAYADPSDYDAASLVGITMAISSLVRLLANSEAFRDLHTHSDDIEPGCTPLDARTTEGLFAALYFLSEQAEQLSQSCEPESLHPSDVPY